MTDLLDLTVTSADIAALAGISERHVRRLGLPKAGRNAYKLGDVFPTLLESLSTGPEGDSLIRERTRLVKAQADKAEMEFAVAKGTIAPVEQLQRAWEKTFALLRARMMQVPQRATLQILGESDETRMKSVLIDEVKLALVDASTAEITEEELQEDDQGDTDD